MCCLLQRSWRYSRQLDKSVYKCFIALTLVGSKDANGSGEHFSLKENDASLWNMSALRQRIIVMFA